MIESLGTHWSADVPRTSSALDGELANPLWLVPSQGRPALGQTEIHLWCAKLDEFSGRLAQLAGRLSASERSRAARFRFQQDRDHFVIQHGLLRTILGLYLSIPILESEFCVGANGKPSLPCATGEPPLHFNLSHSGNLALYAVARQVPLGVDVECVRPMNDLLDIASRFFTRDENAMLQETSPGERTEAFFECWTRKEAVLKATGQGIGNGLAGVEVTFGRGKPVRVRCLPGSGSPAAEWSLHAMQPAEGRFAALAYPGQRRPLKYWTCSQDLLPVGN